MPYGQSLREHEHERHGDGYHGSRDQALRTWRGESNPARLAAENAAYAAPLRVSGLAAVPMSGGAPMYAYLADAADEELVRGTLALMDAFSTGELELAIRNGRSFGFMLATSRGRTIYLSGAEGDPDLRVRLEDGEGIKYNLRPLLEPHDGWATTEPLVAAHDANGVFFTETTNALKLQVLRDTLGRIQESLASRSGASGSFNVRVFSELDNLYSTYAFVDHRSPDHPTVRLTLRHDGQDQPDLHPIVLSDWKAHSLYVAAF